MRFSANKVKNRSMGFDQLRVDARKITALQLTGIVTGESDRVPARHFGVVLT
ncbi:MAG: hypothetical protein HOK28_09780 [Deltaproteobacteria bacterium]|nr:hypothetical protein [Deltaproteobacteria bacterium]